MKVTAIISDELIEEVKKISKGKNITEAITIALREWTALKKIEELNQIVREEPLEFNARLSGVDLRQINRQGNK
jgi:hypothetical protein